MEDESLSPIDYLQEVMRLQLDDAARLQPLRAYNMQAIEAYTVSSIPDAQQARHQAMDHWRLRAAALPARDPSEPFNSALVEEMEHDLDLFDRTWR